MPASTMLEKSFAPKNPLYQRHEALVEADRCLACSDAPCIKACPTSIEIPRFIKAIAQDEPLRSAKIILESNVLGYSCARICPVEELCAGSCVLHHRHEEPIAIGRLQHFACHHALWDSEPTKLLGPKAKKSGKRVACIGSGAASLALAAMLAHRGHDVEIFEKRELVGGLNAWGIAPYKLQFDDAAKEIAWLLKLGMTIHDNVPLVSEEQASAMLERFDAIYLGIGIGDDKIDGGIPEHPCVMGATEFIRRMKTDEQFSMNNIKRAHVIGGGNTAIDAAHEILLLGVPEVTMVYRRGKSSMSAYAHEVDAALLDGLRILEHRSLKSIEVGKDASLCMRLSHSDSSQDDLVIVSDLILFAIGQDKNMMTALLFDEVKLSEKGVISVDKNYRTNNVKIWAGGDCVNGGKEVVNAVAEAKIAAASMHEFLMTP